MNFEPPPNEEWTLETTFRWLEDAARFLRRMGVRFDEPPSSFPQTKSKAGQQTVAEREDD